MERAAGNTEPAAGSKEPAAENTEPAKGNTEPAKGKTDLAVEKTVLASSAKANALTAAWSHPEKGNLRFKPDKLQNCFALIILWWEKVWEINNV
jgi:hypothetical protein